MDTPEAFNSFVESFGFDNFPYVGGAAVRRQLAPRVFTTNESPPSEKIPFHHEMAQGQSVSQPASQFPGPIHHGETELVSCWFCCAQCPSFPRSSSSSARPRLRRAERCGVRGLLTARGVHQ